MWLSGVRRVGKKTLARMLPAAVCMNCDLPSTGRLLRDPELFLNGQEPGTVLVFDEAHRLEDASRLLEIIADEYPALRVLAAAGHPHRTTQRGLINVRIENESTSSTMLHRVPVPDWNGRRAAKI